MAYDAIAEIEELKKKLAQNPESLIFVPLADAYRKSGQLQEAIDVCKKGLEKHPSYMSARVVLGRIYGERNMLEEAVVELQKVEKADVDNIMVHSMLGNVYLKKKMYAEAVNQFQTVLGLNPEDLETQEKLKEALAAKQEPAAVKETSQVKPAEPVITQEAPKAEATAPLAPVEKPEPEKEAATKYDVQKNMRVAELYTKKEEFDKAIEIYQEILNRDQENIIVSQRLREVYDLQEKKVMRNRVKPVEHSKKIDVDKFTTEDILGLMKEAVENDSVDEKQAAPAAKQAEPEMRLEEQKEEAPQPVSAGVEEKVQPKQVLIAPEKGKQLKKVLVDLGNVDGIVGSFFLLRDGSIVASVLPDSINAAEIGTLIASIVEKTEESVRNMNQGKLNQVVISSEAGQLLFTEVLNGVLFMIGNEAINVGKMRLILRDVIDNIKRVLA